MAYLHGVEVIEVEAGSRAIQIVKSAVIGLVGISPIGDKDTPILITNERDAAQFGKQVPGFTIPQSLNAIFAQGAGAVIVVNVFDSTAHTTAVTAESHAVVDGKLKLSFAPIGAVSVLDAEGVASTLVPGTDYSIDEFGNFLVLSTAIANNTTLKFTYKKLNVSGVTASHIIGSYTSGTDVRTGTKCWDLAKNLFGFDPKILISPGFTGLTGVAAELTSLAGKYRAITYIDAPVGTTVAGAIAGRGSTGTINFNTSSKRVELLFPQLKMYDPASDSSVNFPYSAFLAGVRAATDNSDGFWVSTSNKEIKGITGIERPISAGLSDINSDANRLNEVGITTIFNTFGTGNRTWGNRNASFPTNSAADNFTNIIRIYDIVVESLEQASLQFIDRPINQALIDTIRESGNSFIRILIARGALVPGSTVKYNPADNPVEELAAGHLTFEIVFMGSTPAERMTFKSFLDITLLSTLA